MPKVTVSSKGWVVIPAEIRKKYGLLPGKQVQVVDYGGIISLVPVADDPIEASRGLLAGGPSLTRELVREHAEEVKKDSKKWRK
jgi:AbrB family looped-hinge helix DNA binding protein